MEKPFAWQILGGTGFRCGNCGTAAAESMRLTRAEVARRLFERTWADTLPCSRCGVTIGGTPSARIRARIGTAGSFLSSLRHEV